MVFFHCFFSLSIFVVRIQEGDLFWCPNLYLPTCMNMFISFRFLVRSFGSFMCGIVSSEMSQFDFSLSSLFYLFHLSSSEDFQHCIEQVRTMNALVFFLTLIGIIHVFLHLEMVLTMDLLYIIAFTMLRYICYVHRSSRSFIMRIFWILSKIFLDLKDDHFVLFSSFEFVHVKDYIFWFRCIYSFLD